MRQSSKKCRRGQMKLAQMLALEQVHHRFTGFQVIQPRQLGQTGFAARRPCGCKERPGPRRSRHLPDSG